ncbi:MAG: MazG family protein [bacterium]|nr:MazG family protein [bacterium]
MRASRPRVVVVGLGPAGADLLTEATRARIEATPPPQRFVRTRRHPSAGAAAPAEGCDDLYQSAERIEQVYEAIVERLVAAACRHGSVLYAVPGSPSVAERSVQLLAADGRVRAEVHPALSFADLAWSRLGVDPLAAGARIVDGHRFAAEAAGERGPLLVAQCDSAEVMAAVALALPASAAVWVLHRLGLDSERVESTSAAELPRWRPVDHLTSLYIPAMAEAPAAEFVRFGELVATLRAECPWDRTQTHRSLRRHLLEETYEVLEAIDGLPAPAAPGDSAGLDAGRGYEDLEEELGDLLFHVFFHATLAAEQGQFTVGDVVRQVDAKLRRRHPHVFGPGAGAADEASLAAGWEQIKRTEKGRVSAMDGIPEALPALLGALKVQKRAEAVGLDRGGEAEVLSRMRASLEAPASRRDEEWLGSLLFEAVELARLHSLDPESALRVASKAAREEFRRAEKA